MPSLEDVDKNKMMDKIASFIRNEKEVMEISGYSKDKLANIFYSNINVEIDRYINSTKLNGIINRETIDKISTVMFNLSLKDSGTRLLYLDRDNVCYYAVEYDKNFGIGVSALHKIKTFVSLKANVNI